MKKICFISTIHISLQAFFVDCACFLHKTGDYDITFVCNPDEKFAHSLPAYIHFEPVDMSRGISLDGVKACAAMYRIFKRERFDLIQYSTPNAAFYASIAAALAGCRVRNYHLMGLRYLSSAGLGRAVLKGIEKLTCALSTSVECVSPSNMEMGIREGLFPAEKVTVVWNGSSGGVDTARFDSAKRSQWRSEIRAQLGYAPDDFVYGFVGRITRDKGINELLEAYLNLNTADRLCLVGRMEGEETLDPALLGKARENPNVTFCGQVTDVERYYAALDVLILPSYREGFGNVIIEAAAVGTPAIVSNIPGPIDAIDEGRTALLCEVKDAASLQKAMLRIRNTDYHAMGAAAADFAASYFDSEKLFEKILERKNMLLSDME